MTSKPFILKVLQSVAVVMTVSLATLPLHAQTAAMPDSMGKPSSPSSMRDGGMNMKSMMGDMNQKIMEMKSSGNADIDFAMMMRVHHQSAITMAEEELKNGKDTQMRAMAKDIIRAQKKEIAKFDAFLTKHEGSMKTSK
ncbi:MAG: DUF305 domain-containing protein [Burkholderiaceae bacterium]